jgi:hypothetical protein
MGVCGEEKVVDDDMESFRLFQPKKEPSFPAGDFGGASPLTITGEPSSRVTSICRGWLGFRAAYPAMVRGGRVSSLLDGGTGGTSLGAVNEALAGALRGSSELFIERDSGSLFSGDPKVNGRRGEYTDDGGGERENSVMVAEGVLP